MISRGRKSDVWDEVGTTSENAEQALVRVLRVFFRHSDVSDIFLYFFRKRKRHNKREKEEKARNNVGNVGLFAKTGWKPS